MCTFDKKQLRYEEFKGSKYKGFVVVGVAVVWCGVGSFPYSTKSTLLQSSINYLTFQHKHVKNKQIVKYSN